MFETLASPLAVPALPGATKILLTREDCDSFQAKACSLPPLPMSKICSPIFFFVVAVVKELSDLWNGKKLYYISKMNAKHIYSFYEADSK